MILDHEKEIEIVLICYTAVLVGTFYCVKTNCENKTFLVQICRVEWRLCDTLIVSLFLMFLM